MVTARESRTFQQLSAWEPPDSHHMAHLPLEHKHLFLANDVSPGQFNHNLHGLNTVQEKPYLKDVRYTSSHMFGLLDKPTHTSDTRKRYLIFDQSGNHTRLFVSPQVLIPSNTPATADGLREKVVTEMDNRFSLNPNIQEKWEGGDLAHEEGEMQEDTEDINALLYSSSDECNYESDDDDAVTSTFQTPLKIEGLQDKGKLLAELLGEEVASSDDSPPKRQKLSDEKYNKTSAQRVYEDVLESSRASDIDWSKIEKKVKIRNSLKIIASMIPGLKSDNPISIIDEAITYLKSMRGEAKGLGLSQPETDSTTFSRTIGLKRND